MSAPGEATEGSNFLGEGTFRNGVISHRVSVSTVLLFFAGAKLAYTGSRCKALFAKLRIVEK